MPMPKHVLPAAEHSSTPAFISCFCVFGSSGICVIRSIPVHLLVLVLEDQGLFLMAA